MVKAEIGASSGDIKEQALVAMAPMTNATMTSFGTEPGGEIIKEIFLDDPKDVSSSSGTALGPSTFGPAYTTKLATVPFSPVVTLQLVVEAADLEDVSFGPITGNNARLVQMMVEQFFS